MLLNWSEINCSTLLFLFSTSCKIVSVSGFIVGSHSVLTHLISTFAFGQIPEPEWNWFSYLYSVPQTLLAHLCYQMKNPIQLTSATNIGLKDGKPSSWPSSRPPSVPFLFRTSGKSHSQAGLATQQGIWCFKSGERLLFTLKYTSRPRADLPTYPLYFVLMVTYWHGAVWSLVTTHSSSINTWRQVCQFWVSF